MFMKNITWLLVIFNRKKCYAFFLTYRKPADRFLIDVISILKYLQNILILINPIFIEDQLNFTLNTSLNFVYIMTAQNVLFTIVGMVVSTIPTTYGEIYHKIHMDGYSYERIFIWYMVVRSSCSDLGINEFFLLGIQGYAFIPFGIGNEKKKVRIGVETSFERH